MSFWEEHWPAVLGGACVALLIAKFRPIYGPGEVQECVERAR